MTPERSPSPVRTLVLETPAAAPASLAAGLLDSVLAAPPSTTTPAPAPSTYGVARSAAGLLDRFLDADDDALALRLWRGRWDADRHPLDRDRLVAVLQADVARIDALLNGQINAVLHHPSFQKLEASWRGLKSLTEQASGGDIKIRILDVSWRELARDAEKALEFDQSQLFKKVYGDEFDTPGGEPFGLLLGDYDVSARPGPGRPIDDLAALERISHVAAAAFAPFVCGVDAGFFGLESFRDLERPMDFARLLDGPDYLKWRTLRDGEDSRFLGLLMPRVLRRLPYTEIDHAPADLPRTAFQFVEDVAAPDGGGYLWGNSVYAFGAVVARSFLENGWLADIRGATRGDGAGGLVAGLPVPSAPVDGSGVVPLSATDALVGERLEKQLADQGFIVLCHNKDTAGAAFYSSQSVQKPKSYDRPAASANARLSTMLQYMLCVSRFAHYLKVIGRDKIGSFTEPSELENHLHEWLHQYVTSDDDAPEAARAQYPLREAEVQVKERPGKPGSYLCVAHLRPHFQLDEIAASIKLVTQLSPPRAQ
ncbi:MAG: type VI secretion system contractile sheath large subunit [Planctomycetia bacterium]